MANTMTFATLDDLDKRYGNIDAVPFSVDGGQILTAEAGAATEDSRPTLSGSVFLRIAYDAGVMSGESARVRTERQICAEAGAVSSDGVVYRRAAVESLLADAVSDVSARVVRQFTLYTGIFDAVSYAPAVPLSFWGHDWRVIGRVQGLDADTMHTVYGDDIDDYYFSFDDIENYSSWSQINRPRTDWKRVGGQGEKNWKEARLWR